MAGSAKKPASTPWVAAPALEWAAAGLGLALTLGAAGFILWEAAQPVRPPEIALRTVAIDSTAHGYRVEVEATNAGLATAAAVEVEGELRLGDRTVETSTATFDYLPGRGTRTGGLVFENDPGAHELRLRTRGYVRP